MYPNAMSNDKVKTDPKTLQGQLFLAGMSRSGTSWMSRVLNCHPDIVSFGETLYWGRGYMEPEEDGCYSQGQVDRFCRVFANGNWKPSGSDVGSLKCMEGNAFKRTFESKMAAVGQQSNEPAGRAERYTPFSLFKVLSEAFCEAEGKLVAVEKTPHHLMWRDRIDVACPNHRMVITVRDAYGFALSYKHQGDRKSEAVQQDFRRLYHPLGCAIVWRGYARQIASQKMERAERTLVVHFNEFQANEEKVTREVQEFLGVEYHAIAGKVPPANSSFPDRARPELKPEDLFWMNLIARKEMKSLGYELRRTPFAPLRISWSIIKLPGWGLRNLVDLKRKVRGPLVSYLYKWISGR